MANMKIKYVPWTDGGITDAATLEEVFQVYPGAKYRLRRAFNGYGSCDQCGCELAKTDGWFSIATDAPEDAREFFERDGWEVWEDHFAYGWGDVDAAGDLSDEQKNAIVDAIIAEGCNEETFRESISDAEWTEELTYTGSDGNTYYFCCPSCAAAYQSAHQDVRLHKVG